MVRLTRTLRTEASRGLLEILGKYPDGLLTRDLRHTADVPTHPQTASPIFVEEGSSIRIEDPSTAHRE